MKVEIIMPKMGESITEGTLIKWHKKVGEKIKKDEILFEISTDKVDSEVPSPENGILKEILVKENETVEVGKVVAILETDNSEYVDNLQNSPTTTQVGGEVIDIVMPKMGESVTEGTIIKWHKKVGDKVAKDEIIFEISTDKVDTEVPSPEEGILMEVLYEENQTVEVGQPVAKLKTTTGLRPISSAPETVEISEETRKSASDVPLQKEEIPSQNSNRFYSPSVINLARAEGIPLSVLDTLEGTGLKGRLTKKDLEKYIESKKSQTTIFESDKLEKPEKTTGAISAGEEIIPMDNIRRRIMEHMVKSRNTSVHVTAIAEVDMSVIYNFIKESKNRIKLTYMPFIAFATVKALQQYPLMNSSIEGTNIITKKYINLGIAVAIEPNGLIVPNIKHAEEKSVIGLAKAIADLSERTRTKKLIPEDVQNGTFSITNYGVFGTLIGTPIINQPEVGILGVGAVIKKPVVVENGGVESIAIKPRMYLSLSHDHRLIDGMIGSKFLMSIKNILENFDTSSV